MAEFKLPANSIVNKSGKVHKQQSNGSANGTSGDKGVVRRFKIYRYDPDSGDNPRLDTYELDTPPPPPRHLWPDDSRRDHQDQGRDGFHPDLQALLPRRASAAPVQ